mmetsp:Transcript_106905/g.312560  ORF Transcript_106905/g.312560 Transcript_106905/m.312560 type:complete len:247 (+) Transcript_106905:1013-1753(+)
MRRPPDVEWQNALVCVQPEFESLEGAHELALCGIGPKQDLLRNLERVQLDLWLWVAEALRGVSPCSKVLHGKLLERWQVALQGCRLKGGSNHGPLELVAWAADSRHGVRSKKLVPIGWPSDVGVLEEKLRMLAIKVNSGREQDVGLKDRAVLGLALLHKGLRVQDKGQRLAQQRQAQGSGGSGSRGKGIPKRSQQVHPNASGGSRDEPLRNTLSVSLQRLPQAKSERLHADSVRRHLWRLQAGTDP